MTNTITITYPYDHPIPSYVLEKYIALQEVRNQRDELVDKMPYWYTAESSYIIPYEYRKLVPYIPENQSQPVYILDAERNIIDRVEEIHSIGVWTQQNGYWHKQLKRSTVFGYIKNERLWRGKLYFVKVKNYENFCKKFQ